jgi:hypothetical protein
MADHPAAGLVRALAGGPRAAGSSQDGFWQSLADQEDYSIPYSSPRSTNSAANSQIWPEKADGDGTYASVERLALSFQPRDPPTNDVSAELAGKNHSTVEGHAKNKGILYSRRRSFLDGRDAL